MSDLLYRLGQRALGTLPRVTPLIRPGRENQGIASPSIDPFGEIETFRDAVPGTSNEDSRYPAPDNEVKQRPKHPPAPTLGQTIAQIFKDEKDDSNTGKAQSAPPLSSPTRSHIDATPASSSTRPHRESPSKEDPAIVGRSQSRTLDRSQPQATSPEHTPPRSSPNSLPPLHTPAGTVRSSAGRTEVEISIGRIEVHTAPSTARPSTAPARRTPVLSLDDYLARRRGEKA